MPEGVLARTYKPVPTVERFHCDNSFARGIMGPVGSGKSVGMVIEIMVRAMEQRAFNGIRRSRWAVIRNTYPELRSTTIKTFQEWVPPSVCRITFGAPITGHFRKHLPDGTICDLEIFFLSLDSERDVKKLLSLELTGAFVNEAREIPWAVIDALKRRVNRFPNKEQGGSNWYGIIMDSNPPDEDHWWHRMAEDEETPGWVFFRQPGALIKNPAGRWVPNPKAENIDNLNGGYQYYLDQLTGSTEEATSIYIGGNYGFITDGKPVFPEYRAHLHASEDIIPVIPRSQIYLGWDFGLTPSVIIGQLTTSGVLQIIQEFTSEDIGIDSFARVVVRPHLLLNYQGCQVISVGDPAGGKREQTNEKTCFQYLEAAGIPTVGAAPDNEWTRRREALAGFLTRTVGGKPAIVISKNCRMLRKGLAGSYRYRKILVSGTTDIKYREAPEKNQYSHPCEAAMYLALAIDPETARRKSRTGAVYRPEPQSSKGWA